MGFRENLKAELEYSGMLVKELASAAGLKKHTIDNYLSIRGRMPAADVAVKLARPLGVSVEYLVSGEDSAVRPVSQTFSPEVRLLARTVEQFGPEYRKLALALIRTLKNEEAESGKR
jgi:transcriptional regulator with XRE-family HTH domain